VTRDLPNNVAGERFLLKFSVKYNYMNYKMLKFAIIL